MRSLFNFSHLAAYLIATWGVFRKVDDSGKHCLLVDKQLEQKS